MGAKKGLKVPFFSHGRHKLINPIVIIYRVYINPFNQDSLLKVGKNHSPQNHATLDPKVTGITATVGSIKGIFIHGGWFTNKNDGLIASGNSGIPLKMFVKFRKKDMNLLEICAECTR